MASQSGTASSSPSWTWIPIRSLAPRHRERIAAHLVALDEHARYLRFGYPATDAQIAKYVDTLDFERDEVFGIFNRRLELLALAHLAHPMPSTPPDQPPMSEFGVSVMGSARRRGFGRRLFEHAILHARNRGIGALFIHALSENTAMLKIAKNAGATVRREGSETEAWLELPADSLASHLDELVGTQAAELDYRVKAHSRHLGRLLGFSDEDEHSANSAHKRADVES
jgi:GNAT superfamily N-acetyltransferase